MLRTVLTGAGSRDIRLLLSANLISMTGDWLLRTGLAYEIYVLTGSTLASAGALLASLLPQVLLGSIAGVYIDRWDRRRAMVLTNLLLAVTLVPLLAVQGQTQAWIVYAVIAATSCLDPFFTAAEAALVPSLVPPPHLLTVNSLNGQVRDVARLAGAALGGVLAGIGGIALLATADIATFLLAALLVALVRHRPPVTEPVNRPHLIREWIAGLRLVLGRRALRVILVFTLITGIGEAVMGTLMAPFVHDVLGGGARAYGIVMSAQAVGGIAGGLLTTLFGHRFPARALFGWGSVAFGALDLALFLYPLVTRALWPAPALIALVGLPGALVVAGGMTVFQQATEDDNRGRIFGAVGALQGAAMLVGTVAAGGLAGRAGIVPVIAAQGFGYCLAGAAVLIGLRTEVRNEDPTPSGVGVSNSPSGRV
jgi:Na+/melibiose symporter-like transporter